ncbi:hypothetical protein GCM10009529_24270 [Micropruina glycogenica]
MGSGLVSTGAVAGAAWGDCAVTALSNVPTASHVVTTANIRRYVLGFMATPRWSGERLRCQPNRAYCVLSVRRFKKFVHDSASVVVPNQA